MSAKILVLDIETSPNLAYVWGLWNQNVALNQLSQVGDVISVAWKWHGEKGVFFASDFHDGHGVMLDQVHAALDAADVVVHWNGTSFDIPHLYREFVRGGYNPPSPVKQIDLCNVVKKRFRFASNKLDHVAQQLHVGSKLTHAGFTLWRRCMDGDEKAWAVMRRYNRQDVVITDKLYDRLKPWVPSHPHVALYSADPGADTCGRCGSGRLQRRGYAVTSVGRFARYQCQGCGSWSRTGRRDAGVDVRPTA